MTDSQDLELQYREEIKEFIQERLAIIDEIKPKYQRYLCLMGIEEVLSDIILDIQNDIKIKGE